jgi:hypothetical protein
MCLDRAIQVQVKPETDPVLDELNGRTVFLFADSKIACWSMVSPSETQMRVKSLTINQKQRK